MADSVVMGRPLGVRHPMNPVSGAPRFNRVHLPRADLLRELIETDEAHGRTADAYGRTKGLKFFFDAILKRRWF